MFLLDTDILSLLQSGHEGVQRQMANHARDTIGSTVVTQAEVMRNRCERLLKASDEVQLLNAQKWFELTWKLFNKLIILPIDVHATAEYSCLIQVKGIRKIGQADLLIASIALANKATLVTRNRKHFALVPNLVVVNWAD